MHSSTSEKMRLAVAAWTILERVIDNGIAESQCFCLNINDVDRNFVSIERITDSLSKSGVKWHSVPKVAC